MYEDKKGVNVLVAIGNPRQQNCEIGHAEIDEPSETADQWAEMQRIFELEVLIAQLDLLEQQEDDAVDEYPHLVMWAGADDGAEEVEVVAHHQPLEYKHVVDMLRAERGFIDGYRYTIVLAMHQAQSSYTTLLY